MLALPSLRDGELTVRPLRRADTSAWVELRRRNADRLIRWEATPPGAVVPATLGPAAFRSLRRALLREARAGRGAGLAVCRDGELIGQITVSGVVRGAAQSASLGYWVDARSAGQGVIPRAVALAADHCFTAWELHRVEVDVQPSNSASRRVVEKLGFTREGLRRRLLHVDGAWRDHEVWGLTVEDARGGVLARLHRGGDDGEAARG